MNTWNTELQRRFSAANGIEAALYAVAISLEHISDQIEYQTECLGTGEGMTTMLGSVQDMTERMMEKMDKIARAVKEANL